MKKTLFSLGEIMPSSIYKNNKEIYLLKNREKGNIKNKNFFVNKKENKSRKKIKEDNKINNLSKTPIKLKGKTKINKLVNSFNECNKNNNNILSSSTNGKQILLLDYFLKNNAKNIKNNSFLINCNKDEIKNLNKVVKCLLPMKKYSNAKFQNTRYFNRNSNNINQVKKKLDIKKNGNKIIIKNYK